MNNNFPAMASRMFTPAKILFCEVVNNKGFTEKNFMEDENIFFIAFSNFQGTEKIIDDVLFVEDTAKICMPFVENFSSANRIKLLDENSEWEILGTPENWNMQNLFLLFKVRRIKGGA